MFEKLYSLIIFILKYVTKLSSPSLYDNIVHFFDFKVSIPVGV